MMPLAKVFVVMALLCPSVSATDSAGCTGGSCRVDDETSLLQVKKVMNHGSEREKETGDPVVDPGSEWRAFEANKHKVESRVETDAAHRREFAQEQEAERRSAKELVEEQIAAGKHDVARNYEKDKERVEAARTRHHNAERVADEQVEAAKRDWERTSVKKGRVEDAAITGRYAGLNDGAMNAHEKAVEAEEAELKALRAKHHAEELAARAKNLHEEEDAIRKATGRRVEAGRYVSDRAAQDARITEEKERHAADEAVHEITHRDPAITNAADQHAGWYRQRTQQDQDRIRNAEAAEWPHGVPPVN